MMVKYINPKNPLKFRQGKSRIKKDMKIHFPRLARKITVINL